jgi:hypothetical protein
MSNDIVKKDLANLVDDGFAGWEDGVEGDDRLQSSGIIKGTKIKFSNNAIWLRRDDTELPDIELIPVFILRVVQTWGKDNRPIEEKTVILEPHQKFPDIEKMNEEVPREDWVEDYNGNLVGPIQGSHVVYFIHLPTMEQYTFIAPITTIGSVLATSDLRDKIVWMRKVRCPPGTPQNVYPTVKPGKTWMKTRYPGGGRWRPHFQILPDRWVRFGSESPGVSLPSPESLPIATQQASNKPAQQITAEPELPLTTVKEPTLAEEMDDAIPTFDEKPETVNEPKAPAPRPTARRELKKPAAKASARSPSRKRLTSLDAG